MKSTIKKGVSEKLNLVKYVLRRTEVGLVTVALMITSGFSIYATFNFTMRFWQVAILRAAGVIIGFVAAREAALFLKAGYKSTNEE